jgi:hypothetical protein
MAQQIGFGNQRQRTDRNKKTAVKEKVGKFFQCLPAPDCRIISNAIAIWMFQSYKTNRCWPASLVWLFLLTALQPLLLAAKPTARREWQQFLHYEQTFLVPEVQKDPLWEYVLQRYSINTGKISSEHSEFQSSYQYFDNTTHSLKDKQLVLFQQTLFAVEGQQQQVELWQKRNTDWLITVFKDNKKPDKGKKFTNHPLLKLLRSKDRPGLDSLLQQWQINSADLSPVLETTQHQYRLILRLHGSDWLVLTLREVQSEAPGHLFYELNIQPDRKYYTSSTPARRLQVKAAADTLANHLKKQFPDLLPEHRNSYLKMLQVRQTDPPGLIGNKILFATLLLVAFLLFFFLKQPVRKWIKGKRIED